MSQEVLKSSKKAGGVKSFVFTSSKIAAFLSADAPKKVDQDTWFDNAASLAKVEQDTVMKRLYVYAASKVAGEKALWRFVEEEKVSKLYQLESSREDDGDHSIIQTLN